MSERASDSPSRFKGDARGQLGQQETARYATGLGNRTGENRPDSEQVTGSPADAISISPYSCGSAAIPASNSDQEVAA